MPGGERVFDLEPIGAVRGCLRSESNQASPSRGSRTTTGVSTDLPLAGVGVETDIDLCPALPQMVALFTFGRASSYSVRVLVWELNDGVGVSLEVEPP